MECKRILPKEEVIRIGYEFDGERVVYAGEYGEQVCELRGSEEIPITGIVYELYDNGNLQYYQHYYEGIKNGEDVTFYKNGKIESRGTMYKATRHGKTTYWYENGQLKSEIISKYSFVIDRKEWDVDGNLVKDERDVLTDFGRSMISKYDEFEPKNQI